MASGFKSFVEVEEARERLLAGVDPLDRSRQIPLAEADDRILAQVVEAPVDLPREDRAAMDGFAVRHQDTAGASERAPCTLEAAEEAGPDRAVRVHTGTPMPEGTDAVVMVEEAEVADGRVEVHERVHEGRHVAHRGEDVRAGQQVLPEGHRLRPSDLGLLRALEVDEVEVVDRVRVAVVPTGDEIVEADPGPGESIESNGAMLQALLARWGCQVDRRGIVPDDPDRLDAAVRAAVEDADVVLTVGGTSVGARDHLPEVLDGLGERRFHGVALRPGHPVGAWRVDDLPVVTLPGYPVACLVTATLLVRPLLGRLGRRPAVPDPCVRARLSRKVDSKIGDLHVVRVRLDRDGEGWIADPTRAKGAGVISSVTAADGVVLVPPRREGLDAGAEVEVVIWE